MFEDILPLGFRQALIDRFEGFEIVELLNLDAETVVDALADILVENLPVLKEALGIDVDAEDEEEFN